MVKNTQVSKFVKICMKERAEVKKEKFLNFETVVVIGKENV